jgi:large subunit ribosomal protein L4
LSDAAFGRAYNEALVHQVVTAYHGRGPRRHQARRSRAPKCAAAARSRGARKARARRAPARFAARSGSAAAGAFAAKPRDFSQKVNRKMYRAAMQSMVSELVRQDRLVAVESLELSAPKTKLLISKLAEFGLTRALILVEAYEEKLFLAARNVPYVEVMPVASLDPLSLIKHDKVIATVGALKLLEQRLGGAHE